MDNIYEALKTIKDVCRENGNCVDCPFNELKYGTLCGIKKTPSNWEIREPEKRYFKLVDNGGIK